MPFLTDFGSFVQGATDRASTLKQQEHAEDEQRFKMLMEMFHTLSQSRNPQIAGEAQQGAINAYMEYLGYKHPQGKNKLHKMAESFLGTRKDLSGAATSLENIQNLGMSGGKIEQPGVGTGNAKTQIGGLQGPPAPPSWLGPAMSQEGPPAMPTDLGVGGVSAAPPVPSDVIPPIMAGAPAMPTPPMGVEEQLRANALAAQQSLQSGFGLRPPSPDEELAMELYKQHMLNKEKFDYEGQIKNLEDKLISQRELANISATGAEQRKTQAAAHTVTAPFDIVDDDGKVLFAKGQPFDERIHSIITEAMKANKPNLKSAEMVDMDGHKRMVFVDQNAIAKGVDPAKAIVASVDFGEVMEGIKGPFEEWEKAFMRENKRRPNQDEIRKEQRQLVSDRVGIQLDLQNASVGAGNSTVIDEHVRRINAGEESIQDVGRGGGRAGLVLRNKVLQDPNLQVRTVLTPAGSAAVASVDPILRMIERAKDELFPFKDSNAPLSLGLQRILYDFGIATDESELIANLELGRVIGGARVLQGSSRAIQALEKAQQHTPNSKLDSGKLMWDKLDNIEQNLLDIKNAAFTYENKYGIKVDKEDNPIDKNPPRTPPPGSKVREWDPATGTFK